MSRTPDRKTTHDPRPTIHEIAFIYFDVDDTLLDHRQAERAALADLYAAFPGAFNGTTVAEVQDAYHAHNVPLWERYSDGDIGKEELKRLRFEQLVETLAVEDPAPARLGAHYIERYTAHWTLTEGARAAFTALADRFPVGLLTNGFAETQHGKLERFPFLEARAETVIVSEEVGHMKPDPRIFAHAAEAASTPPEAILYVGNSLRSDVEGGLNAGWQVAWYVPNGTSKAPGEAVAGNDRLFRFQAWSTLVEQLT